jgi:hypothetical protein
VGNHQRIAQKQADYLANLNAGDIDAVAQTPKQVKYYTGVESIYAAGMTRESKQIAKALGLL